MMQLISGFYRVEQESSFPRKCAEVLSRMVWQQPQTLIGFLYNAGMLLSGKATGVARYHGAAAVKCAGWKGHSASLGIFLSMGDDKRDSEAKVGVGAGSYTTMHEYGHYLQSRRWGPLYLFVFGLPSLFGATYPEHDANRRAAAFFESAIPGFKWNKEYYPIGSFRHRYCHFND
jgi:hypothetical protein